MQEPVNQAREIERVTALAWYYRLDRVILRESHSGTGGSAQIVRAPRQSSSPFTVGVLSRFYPPARISSYYC